MDTTGLSRADRIFVSSSVFEAKTVPAVVEECGRRGLTCLELTSSFPYYAGVRQDVVAAKEGGMQLLVHNYFPPPPQGFVLNLASADPQIHRRSIEHCREALVLSAEIGAPFFSVHAGLSVDPSPSELGRRLAPAARRAKADAKKVFFDTVALVCETAEACGVDLLIENNVVSRRNFVEGRNEVLLGVTGDDFEELFEVVPRRRLGMLLDVGHLNVSARTIGMDRLKTIEQVRASVRALHLSDNDGETDDNRPFDRSAWFVPHLATFSHAFFVIETRPLEPPALAACLRIVEAAR